MATTRTAGQRPMRADARRNYDNLLAAAREIFAERGTGASLEDVAARAGVGPGTLYRHFPHRDALLAEVISDSIDVLHAEAEELLEAPDPDEALFRWMREAVAHTGTYRGLADSLMSCMYEEGSRLYASCESSHRAGARLLARAQELGTVRPELDGDDLFELITSVAWAAERSAGDRDSVARLLPLVFDGMRVRT